LKNFLITGGSGFIGDKLVKALANKNTSIRILSRENQPGFKTIFCDLVSEIIPEDAMIDVDTVFHLAGYTHDSRGSSEFKYLYKKINEEGTVKLAKLAIQSGVKRFIFISSVKAGGSSIQGLCVSEKDQTEPEGIYGKTKRRAELKLIKLGKTSNMHISIIRPSLVYGPNMKGNLELMLRGIKAGWFPPLPKVDNCRSIIHVDNLIEAILFLAKTDHISGEIYIATDNQTYSSREIFEVMCRISNKAIPRWGVPKIFFDFVAIFNSDIRYKTNKLLGDECYSSEKLKALGFKARRKLEDMNETSF